MQRVKFRDEDQAKDQYALALESSENGKVLLRSITKTKSPKEQKKVLFQRALTIS
jgi:hypothetical protein